MSHPTLLAYELPDGIDEDRDTVDFETFAHMVLVAAEGVGMVELDWSTRTEGGGDRNKSDVNPLLRRVVALTRNAAAGVAKNLDGEEKQTVNMIKKTMSAAMHRAGVGTEEAVVAESLIQPTLLMANMITGAQGTNVGAGQLFQVQEGAVVGYRTEEWTRSARRLMWDIFNDLPLGAEMAAYADELETKRDVLQAKQRTRVEDKRLKHLKTLIAMYLRKTKAAMVLATVAEPLQDGEDEDADKDGEDDSEDDEEYSLMGGPPGKTAGKRGRVDKGKPKKKKKSEDEDQGTDEDEDEEREGGKRTFYNWGMARPGRSLGESRGKGGSKRGGGGGGDGPKGGGGKGRRKMRKSPAEVYRMSTERTHGAGGTALQGIIEQLTNGEDVDANPPHPPRESSYGARAGSPPSAHALTAIDWCSGGGSFSASLLPSGGNSGGGGGGAGGSGSPSAEDNKVITLQRVTAESLRVLARYNVQMEIEDLNVYLTPQNGVPLCVAQVDKSPGCVVTYFTGFVMPQDQIRATSVRPRRNGAGMYYNAVGKALAQGRCDNACVFNENTDPVTSSIRCGRQLRQDGEDQWVGILANLYGHYGDSTDSMGGDGGGGDSATLIELLRKASDKVFKEQDAKLVRRSIELDAENRALRFMESKKQDLVVLKALRHIDITTIVQNAPRLVVGRVIESQEHLTEFIGKLRDILRRTTESFELEPDFGLDDLAMFVREQGRTGTDVEFLVQGVAMVLYTLQVQIDDFEHAMRQGTTGAAIPNAHRKGGCAEAYLNAYGSPQGWWNNSSEMPEHVPTLARTWEYDQDPKQAARTVPLPPRGSTTRCRFGAKCKDANCAYGHPSVTATRPSPGGGGGSGGGGGGSAKNDRKCFDCGETGHIQSNCPNSKGGGDGGLCSRFLTSLAKRGQGECKFKDQCMFEHEKMSKDEAKKKCDSYMAEAEKAGKTSKAKMFEYR